VPGAVNSNQDLSRHWLYLPVQPERAASFDEPAAEAGYIGNTGQKQVGTVFKSAASARDRDRHIIIRFACSVPNA
jgi:hypothetical protein